MRVTFLGGPLSGRTLFVAPGTASVRVPILPPVSRAVYHRPEDTLPELFFAFAEYRITPLTGRHTGEAHGVPA